MSTVFKDSRESRRIISCLITHASHWSETSFANIPSKSSDFINFVDMRKRLNN